MSVSALRPSPTRKPRPVAGARRAAMPGFIEPCDPTLQERAPVGGNWVYEIKPTGIAPRSIFVMERSRSTRGADTTGPSSSQPLPRRQLS